MTHLLAYGPPYAKNLLYKIREAAEVLNCEATLRVVDEEGYDEAHEEFSAYYAAVIEEIEGTDLLIVEISEPSTSLGYAIGHAASIGKPALCIFRSGSTVDSTLLREQSEAVKVVEYTDSDDAVRLVSNQINLFIGG